MRLLSIAMLATGAGWIAGCITQPSSPSNENLGTLTVSPSRLSVPRGRTVPLGVGLQRSTSSSEPVTVAASGLPQGVSMAPATLSGSSGTVSFSASTSAPLASDAPVSLTAASDAGTASVGLSLSVTDPSFQLEVTPATLTIGAGSARSATVTVTRRDLSDPIEVTVSGLPSGVTADRLSIPGNRGSLVLRVGPTTPQRSWPLVVSGASGVAFAQAPLTLRVVEPSALDTDFGSSGVATTTFDLLGGRTTSVASAVVVQPDGKILVAGKRQRPTSVLPASCFPLPCVGIAVARYNANGTLDSTFGGDGGVPVASPAGTIVLEEVAVNNQFTPTSVAISDAGILIAGSVSATGPLNTSLVRLTPDGLLDRTFNGDGGRPGRAPATIKPVAVALSEGEKILVVGQTPAAFALARYNPDGTVDQSFGDAGILARSFSISGTPSASAAMITADGKVKVVGTIGGRVGVMAFDSRDGGSVDESFNGNGQVLIQLGASSSTGQGAAGAQDNLIVAARALDGGHGDIALASFQPDGGLDPAFGAGGITHTVIAEGSAPQAAATSSSKIAVAGTIPGLNRFLVVRYTLDGSPDPTFVPGGSGVLIGVPDIPGANNSVGAMAFQSDGKIVLVGSATVNGLGGPASEFVIIRYASGM